MARALYLDVLWGMAAASVTRGDDRTRFGTFSSLYAAGTQRALVMVVLRDGKPGGRAYRYHSAVAFNLASYRAGIPPRPHCGALLCAAGCLGRFRCGSKLFDMAVKWVDVLLYGVDASGRRFRYPIAACASHTIRTIPCSGREQTGAPDAPVSLRWSKHLDPRRSCVANRENLTRISPILRNADCSRQLAVIARRA